MPRNEYKKAFKQRRLSRSQKYIDEEQHHTNVSGDGYTSFIDSKGLIRYFTRISPSLEYVPKTEQMDVFRDVHDSLRKFSNCTKTECNDLFQGLEFKIFLTKCYLLLGIGETQAPRISRTRVAKYVRNYIRFRCTSD